MATTNSKSVKYRIGMMIHDFETEYSKPLMEGMEKFCHENSIECMFFVTRARKWTYGIYDYQYYIISQLFTTNNLDGLIIISTTQCMFISKEEFSKVVDSFKPLVVGSIGVEFKNTINLRIEQEGAFKDLLRHVIEVHGRRNLILLSSTSSAPDIKEREKAFREICKEYKLPFTENRILHPTYDLRLLSKNLEAYRQRYGIDFDAVIGLDDKVSFGCIEYLTNLGKRIPEDIIVTGYDDTTTAKMSSPTLTTVNQCIFEQGYAITSLVYKKIIGESVPSVSVVPAIPIYRQSCGCLSADDNVHDAKNQDGALISTKNNSRFYVEMRYHYVREEMNLLQYFLQDIQTNMTIPALKRRLIVHLQKFGVKACTICLFNEPVYNTSEDGCELPHEAYLFLGFDENQTVFNDSNSIEVNPYKSLQPEEFFPRNSETKITMSLFNTQYLYGYVTFVPGSIDLVLYPIIFSAITSSLVSAFSIFNTKCEAEKLKNEKTSLEEKNDNLMTISRTDELTNLFNRRGLLLYGQQNIEMALEMKQTGLVVFGDMDGLKTINDTYGHEAGNRAIQAEAILLRKAFRTADIIGRIGGDEFVIIAVSMDMTIFKRVKENIQKLSDDWNSISGEQFKVSISLGAVQFDYENYNLNELLDKADKAQYKEKKRRKAIAEVKSDSKQ